MTYEKMNMRRTIAFVLSMGENKLGQECCDFYPNAETLEDLILEPFYAPQ